MLSLRTHLRSRTARSPRLRARPRLEGLESRTLLDVGDTLTSALNTGIGPGAGTYTLPSELIGDGAFGDRDVDIFRFQAAAGGTLRATTSGAGGCSDVDTILRLFSSTGQQLAVNDDFGGTLCSQINFEFATAGTYYIGVSGFANFTYNPMTGGSGTAGDTGEYGLEMVVGELQPGTLRGNKFYDANVNGVRDEGDFPLEGWPIYLDQNRNGSWEDTEAITVTDANGDYEFANLPTGAYTVAEFLFDGWQQTAPAGGTRTVEDFESGSIANYNLAFGPFAPSPFATAVVAPVAAFEGGMGLYDYAGNDWIYRNDGGAGVGSGDLISTWVQFANVAEGRLYFGFGATRGGTLSFVLAANTNSMLLQYNPGYDFVEGAPATQTYQADHWYRMEVEWGVGGALTGRLFDSDGTTLLNTVTANFPLITMGTIAFRAFSAPKYWDAVEVTPGLPGTYTVSLLPGQEVAGLDFGNYFAGEGGGSPGARPRLDDTPVAGTGTWAGGAVNGVVKARPAARVDGTAGLVQALTATSPTAVAVPVLEASAVEQLFTAAADPVRPTSAPSPAFGSALARSVESATTGDDLFDLTFTAL